jgi:hypothetical protein
MAPIGDLWRHRHTFSAILARSVCVHSPAPQLASLAIHSMKILFVHQNMPGQYRHLAPALAAMPGNEVVFVTQRRGISLPGVAMHAYRPHRAPGEKQHCYLRDTEAGVLNGQAVAKLALALKQAGFVPDVMLGHNAWGEIWYLKDVFPNTPLVGYFEFFYRAAGADVDFDPAQPLTVDDGPRLRTKNLGNLLGLEAADWGNGTRVAGLPIE